ncbi:MAG: glycosyltransferase, partial [Lachnospiraceae bacterium]|nr:glycosyltransferase [Lachnospiraceae bacterium]
MKSVSIIMPLFNAEKFLAEALQSILNQTYKNFELICINDCSTDHTRSILNNFQNQDERIKVLDNKEHLGAAISRNRGLDVAEGEYVSFLDGDDIFEEELIEKSYDTIVKYDADIVIFEYTHVPSDTIYNKRLKERPDTFYETYCDTVFCIRDFKPRDFPNWSDSPCDKLYRKRFIEDNKLEFQNLTSFNDIYFAKMALFSAKRIVCLNDKRIMVYARDHFETSRISSDRNPMCAYYAMEKLARTLQERNMMEDYAEYLYYAIAIKFWYVLVYRKEERRNENFYKFLHEEGIAKCIEYGKEFYDRIDIYDKYI